MAATPTAPGRQATPVNHGRASRLALAYLTLVALVAFGPMVLNLDRWVRDPKTQEHRL